MFELCFFSSTVNCGGRSWNNNFGSLIDWKEGISFQCRLVEGSPLVNVFLHQYLVLVNLVMGLLSQAPRGSDGRLLWLREDLHCRCSLTNWLTCRPSRSFFIAFCNEILMIVGVFFQRLLHDECFRPACAIYCMWLRMHAGLNTTYMYKMPTSKVRTFLLLTGFECPSLTSTAQAVGSLCLQTNGTNWQVVFFIGWVLVWMFC